MRSLGTKTANALHYPGNRTRDLPLDSRLTARGGQEKSKDAPTSRETPRGFPRDVCVGGGGDTGCTENIAVSRGDRTIFLLQAASKKKKGHHKSHRGRKYNTRFMLTPD